LGELTLSRSGLTGRCSRALAALAVVSTFVSGPQVSAAPAVPSESNTDQKIAVGREVGLNVTPTQYSMKDCSFTIWVWDWATRPERSRDNAKVAEAAATAFTTNSETNPESCYRFITDTVYTAHQADVIERINRVERNKQRIAAAVVVGWTDLTTADLDSTLKEFVFQLFMKSKEGSEVRATAAAVLTPASTDAQRTTYVTTGIFTARDVDLQRTIEEAERKRQEELARIENEEKRAQAWNVAARAPLTDDLKRMTDREFVGAIFSRTTGKWVKADAQAAMDKTDPKAWKDYIFTGVHAAHQKDLVEQNQQDAIETEKRIREILDNAERDGYQPNLARAARLALAGDLPARHAFLSVGKDEALKLDLIKPESNRVVELQGVGSGRCLQVWGLPDDAKLPGQLQELWKCVRGTKQVWELLRVEEGQYMVLSMHSRLCLDVAGESVVQNPCDSTKQSIRWKFIENTADGSFQLQNVATGRYATAQGSGTADATLIVQGSNTNAIDQRWRIIDPTHRADVVGVAAGLVSLKGVESGRCLQTAGAWDTPGQGANADFAEMELWDCVAGSTKQKWEIIPLGHNRYALKNLQSGKCLDVKYGWYDIGLPLVQYTCHYGGTEQFDFTQAVDNSYGLQSVLTGRFGDAVGHAQHNGAVVQWWDHTGYANQRWTVVYETA
jgi:hypothetical protein